MVLNVSRYYDDIGCNFFSISMLTRAWSMLETVGKPPGHSSRSDSFCIIISASAKNKHIQLDQFEWKFTKWYEYECQSNVWSNWKQCITLKIIAKKDKRNKRDMENYNFITNLWFDAIYFRTPNRHNMLKQMLTVQFPLN